MHCQKIFRMPENIPYLSAGFDVDADFTWMSIMLPSGILIGRLFEIIRSDLQSRELATLKIKGAQETHSLGNRCFLESIGIYHISLLCFLYDKGFDCAVINPITTESNTNMNVRKLHSNKFDSRKAAKVGLDASLKASTVPGDAIINLRNLAYDYYYFKDLQSAIVLRLHVELKVSFPARLNMFSKVTTQTSLELLETYPLTADTLAVPRDELVEIIRSTACFRETYVLARHDIACTAVKDAVVFGRAFPSNALRIRLYTKMYKEYQARLDSILEELHQAIGKLEGTPGCGRTSFIQTLRGVGFLSAVVLIAEMESFDLFSSPKKLYAYFGLGPGINDSGKFHGNRIHASKWGSSLAGHTLHMVAIDNLKVGKATKTPVNPVIYGYYTHKYASKKKSVAVRAIVYKIYGIISATLRDNKPLELITSEEHRGRYAIEHPESVNTAA